jgi:hypothetical protein
MGCGSRKKQRAEVGQLTRAAGGFVPTPHLPTALAVCVASRSPGNGLIATRLTWR